MVTYTFPREGLYGVLAHIDSFDTVIESLSQTDFIYTITLSNPVPANQYDHLNAEFGLTLVE